MLEMLKERKAALEARGKKGFTLMEMLIVIAIIAVLIAIAIPVLGAQLENARDATSVANMRSAYAEAAAAVLDNSLANQGNIGAVTPTTDGKGKQVTIKNVKIESQSSNPSWSGKGAELPFPAPADPGANGDYNMTFTFADDGTVSATLAAASSGGNGGTGN